MKRINLKKQLKIVRFGINSLFFRNFLLILLIIVVPLGGVLFYLSNYINENVKSQIKTLNTQSLIKTRDTLDTIFSEMERLSTQIYFEDDIKKLFLPNSLKDIDEMEYIEMMKKLNTFILINDYIDSIYVYEEKNEFLLTNTKKGLVLQFDDTLWIDEYKDIKLSERVRYIARKKKHGNIDFPLLISLIRPVELIPSSRIGAVTINIDIYKLRRFIGNAKDENMESTYIVDENGQILYSIEANDFMSSIKEAKVNLEWFENREMKYEIQTINGKDSAICMVPSNRTSLYYVSIVPLDYFEKQDLGWKRTTLGFIVAVALIAILISLLISIKAYMPIRSILSLISRFTQSDNDSNYRIDETEYIKRNILKTMNSNRQMEEELANTLIILQQAQTAALQSQINPHFMHNTLETIRIMVLKEASLDSEAASMLSTFSKMLRTSMESKEYLVSLEEEIGHCKYYIELLRMRYKNKIEVIWEVPNNLYKYKILKLSLQPFIENSVYHGIKPKREDGKISIAIRLEDEDLLIEIVDNGVGMNFDKIDSLNKELKDKYKLVNSHMGIKNVNQRIKLIFGREYGVYIDSMYKDGCRVIINMKPVLDDLVKKTVIS